jgi:hypothetical protein
MIIQTAVVVAVQRNVPFLFAMHTHTRSFLECSC